MVGISIRARTVEQQALEEVVHLALRSAEERLRRRIGASFELNFCSAAWLEGDRVRTKDPSTSISVRQSLPGHPSSFVSVTVPVAPMRRMLGHLRGQTTKRGELDGLELSALRELAATVSNSLIRHLAIHAGVHLMTGLPVIEASPQARDSSEDVSVGISSSIVLRSESQWVEAQIFFAVEPSMAARLRLGLVSELEGQLLALEGLAS